MDPNDINKQFEEAEARAQSLQLQYSQCAQYLGQIYSVLKTTKPYWVNLANQAADVHQEMILESGSAVVTQLNHSLDDISHEHLPPLDDCRSTSLSALSFGSNTSATSHFLPVEESLLKFTVKAIPTINYLNDSGLSARLGNLDPSLGKTCREIWECLYGTTADPERSALFMMRQTWDHLFGYLAPDSEVRDAEFFVKKEGERPDLVTREERLRFAIAKRICNVDDQARLLVATLQMLELYQELNRAHKRGTIDKTKAVLSLHALYDWLVQWADALEKTA